MSTRPDDPTAEVSRLALVIAQVLGGNRPGKQRRLELWPDDPPFGVTADEFRHLEPFASLERPLGAVGYTMARKEMARAFGAWLAAAPDAIQPLPSTRKPELDVAVMLVLAEVVAGDGAVNLKEIGEVRGADGGSYGAIHPEDARRYRRKFSRRLAVELLVAAGPPVSRAEQAAAAADLAELAEQAELADLARRLVGRDHDLRDFLERWEGHRLVTVVGPGGIGKSTFVANAIRIGGVERHGQVWRLSLDATGDVPAITKALMPAMGVTGLVDSHDVLLELVTAKASDRGLLVIENAEHAPAAVRTVCEALLRSCPGLSVVVTSEVRLDAEAEVVVRMRGLPVDGAAQLFVARAIDAGSSADDLADRDTLVKSICETLGGSPFLIQLAAALVPALALEVLDRLLAEDVLQTLPDGDPDGAGARSARAVLARSWSHLTPEQATFLERCARFASSFDLDAVTAVPGFDLPAGQPVRLLTGLVARSLIEKVEGDRYRLLEPVRSFGRSRAADTSDDPGPLRRRFVEHYGVVGRAAYAPLLGRERMGVAGRLRPDLPNLLQAVAWAEEDGVPSAGIQLIVSLRELWLIETSTVRMAEALDRLLAAPPDAAMSDDIRLVGLADCIAGLQRGRAAEDRYLGLADEARRLVDVVDPPGLAAYALCATVGAADFGAAVLADARSAVELARQAVPHDPYVLSLALTIAWFAEDNARNRAEAARLADECIIVARGAGYPVREAVALANRTALHIAAEEATEARPLLEAAARLLAAYPDPAFETLVIQNLGLVELAEGRRDLARRRFGEGLDLALRSGEACHVPLAILAIALTAREEADAVRLHAASRRMGAAGTYDEPERGYHNAHLARLKKSMGAVAFQDAWREGEVLSDDVAVALAQACA